MYIRSSVNDIDSPLLLYIRFQLIMGSSVPESTNTFIVLFSPRIMLCCFSGLTNWARSSN